MSQKYHKNDQYIGQKNYKFCLTIDADFLSFIKSDTLNLFLIYTVIALFF